jgi:hypothetical protein
VDTTNPDKLLLNESSIVPTLVNAIQELKAEIDSLRAEISAFKIL